jgi:hypothetical protein
MAIARAAKARPGIAGRRSGEIWQEQKQQKKFYHAASFARSRPSG